jgi:hypothetical protein
MTGPARQFDLNYGQPKSRVCVVSLTVRQNVMNQNIPEYLRLIRFGWADKAALLLGVLYSTALLYMWSLAFLVVGNIGAKHLWANFGILGVELEILIVGSAWLVMRLADFLAGGSTYWFFAHKFAPKGTGL